MRKDEAIFTVRYPFGKNYWLYSGPLFLLFLSLIINSIFGFPYYFMVAVAIVVLPFIVLSIRRIGQQEIMRIEDASIKIGDKTFTAHVITRIRVFPVGGNVYLLYKNPSNKSRAEHIQAVDDKDRMLRYITHWCRENQVPVESL